MSVCVASDLDIHILFCVKILPVRNECVFIPLSGFPVFINDSVCVCHDVTLSVCVCV